MKIAIIGCGRWGTNHLRILSELLKRENISAADINKNILKNIEKYTDKFYTDYKELIKKEKPDGIIIATPSITHYKIARYCIEKGIDTFVEKPLCTSLKEAEALLNLAYKKNVLLVPGHLFLFKKFFKKIKNSFNKKYVNSTLYFSRINNGPSILNEGVIYDLAVHDIYITLNLLGTKPEKVYTYGRIISGALVEANIIITFPNGIANITCSWLGLSSTRFTHILNGSKEFIWNDISPAYLLIRYSNKKSSRKFKQQKILLYKKSEREEKFTDEGENALLEEDKSFINAIKTRKPSVTAEEGVETVRLITKIHQSIKTRREVKI